MSLSFKEIKEQCVRLSTTLFRKHTSVRLGHESLITVKKFLAVSFVIASLIGCAKRQQIMSVSSNSMSPGLTENDLVQIDNDAKFQRGTIVAIGAPHGYDPVLKAKYSRNFCFLTDLPVLGNIFGKLMKNPACDVFIQRIVAMPGNHAIINVQGEAFVDGIKVEEGYVTNYCPVDSNGLGPCRTIDAVVPSGYVLALGDNRANSWDGRFWPGGSFVPISEIRGVVSKIVYPTSREKDL